MKRILPILLALPLVFCLCGCEKDNSVSKLDTSTPSQTQTESISTSSSETTTDAVSSIVETSSGSVDTPTPSTDNSKPAVSSELTPTVTFTDKELMIMQFESLGLTNAEAIEIASVFENVGITKIWDISKGLGSGIDGEQRYGCKFYNFNPNVDCIKLQFIIVKRKIQRISICFSPYGKLGEYPITHKYKELNLLDGIQEDTHSDSVTLYYKKLKNMAVDENSVGYRAIYNYETHSVSKYK